MPETYTIGTGESVLYLAASRGMLWATIWNDSGNADLKSKRVDSDILAPGDILTIPDKTEKQASGATEKTNKFKMKTQHAQLVLILRRIPKKKGKLAEMLSTSYAVYQTPAPVAQQDEAASAVPYVLYADNALVAQGKTDGNGQLSEKLGPTAKDGKIIFNRGTPQELSFDLHFRELQPLSEITGACQRLYNLGYSCPTDATEITPDVQAAIVTFQNQYKLTVNGQIDDPTRSKIKDVYGA